MDAKTLLEKVREAKNDIKAAEAELDRAVETIEAAPRASKTTISEAVETALENLRAANEKLLDLEQQVKDSPNRLR